VAEKYELRNPYQPLGPPSRAYRDGWDRVFGKPAKPQRKGRRRKGGGVGGTPARTSRGDAYAHTPALGPDQRERPVSAPLPCGRCGHAHARFLDCL